MGRELVALVHLVGDQSSAVFQLAAERAAQGDPEVRAEYYQRLQRLALSSGVPIVFGVSASSKWLAAMPVIQETIERGGQMYGLTHCRGLCSVQSFQTRLSFDVLPEWQDIRRQPLDAQQTLLRDPDVRRRLVWAAHHGQYGDAIGAEPHRPDYDQFFIMYSPYLANPSVADEARRRSCDPVEVIIDVALESDLQRFFLQQLTPQADTDLIDLLQNPNTAMTFSDAGAHVSQICDASIQSHLLAYWVRERQAFPLELAIPMITSRPARVWRLHDRGLLAPGYAADVTIFDPDTVAPLMPRLVWDLPGGSRRLEQRGEGYAATIVNGQVLTCDGEATEARSGRLLRAGRMSVPT